MHISHSEIFPGLTFGGYKNTRCHAQLTTAVYVSVRLCSAKKTADTPLLESLLVHNRHAVQGLLLHDVPLRREQVQVLARSDVYQMREQHTRVDLRSRQTQDKTGDKARRNSNNTVGEKRDEKGNVVW